MANSYFSHSVLASKRSDIVDGYSLYDGYLFHRLCLCIPKSSMRFLMIKEAHNSGHFCVDKIIALVRDRFYWPSVDQDIAYFIKGCQDVKLVREMHLM